MRWLRRSIQLLAGVQSVIGVAGINGDLKAWGKFLPVLDHWVTHYLLLFTGMAALTYPQWLPWARRKWSGGLRVKEQPSSASLPPTESKLRPPAPCPPEIPLTLSKPNWKLPKKPATIFSPRSPEELLDEVKGKTKMAAKLASQRHVGHWLKVSDRIEDMEEEEPLGTIWVIMDGPFICYFKTRDWGKTLMGCNPGDPIQLIGEISSINASAITLKNCELVKLNFSDTGSCWKTCYARAVKRRCHVQR